MSLRNLTSLSLLLLASLGTIAACSSDSDGPAAPATSSSTTRISAKEGGKVSDPSGKATLTIPAGALAEDTDITLSVSAATDATVAGIYDFGPDGLAFLKPATLEIHVDAAAVGDKQVAVALETDGKFVALAGSSYANGVATAEIEHFSKFSVVFIDGKAQRTSCDDAVEAFVACGGDITGTWVFDEICFAGMKDSNAPCPEYSVTLEIDLEDVEITFNADGTWSRLAGTQKATRTVSAPLSCFDGAADCAAIPKDEKVICTGEAVCTCAAPEQSQAIEAEEGTYVVEDNTLTVSTKDRPGEATEYCIQGDRLYAIGEGAKGTEGALYSYRRK